MPSTQDGNPKDSTAKLKEEGIFSNIFSSKVKPLHEKPSN